MSENNELLIKINADAKDLTKKFDNIKEQTASLEDQLKKAAQVSAIAFAALSAEVGLSVHAYTLHEEATNRLAAALQNQGIYSKELLENYEAQADALQNLTGVSNEQIKAAQTSLQAQIGAIPVTKELTKAVLDFATLERIDVVSAADLVGKTIGSTTNALTRYGIQLDGTAPKSVKLREVLEGLNRIAGGQAEAMGKGVGIFRIFGQTVDDVQKKIGEKFAPALETAAHYLNDVFQWFEHNDEAVKFAAAILATAVAVTGLATGLTGLSGAFLIVRAALIALNVQLSITEALFAALGIGLAVAALTELVLHFHNVSGAVKALIHDFGELSSVAKGVGNILAGMATLNFDRVKQGVAEIGEAFKKMGHDAAAGWSQANHAAEDGEEKQDAVKKAIADKMRARQEQHDRDSATLIHAKKELIIAETKGESDAVLALRKEEIAELKALQASQDQDEKALLHKKLAQTQNDLRLQKQQDVEIQKEFNKEQEQAIREHGNKTVQIQTEADRKEIQAIQKDTLTKDQAQKKVYTDDLKVQQASHNQRLQDEIKYGKTFAAINEAMNSEVYKGTAQAFGNLTQLQQSNYGVLKQIGKVAAVADIAVKTAQSAMNIYEGFSTIPIVGPALGIAGAAAAVAFGAEQIGKVQGASSGALVGGSGIGDSQPFMLEPGELVSPKKSFNEVIDGVAHQRGYKKGEEGGEGSYAEVQLTLKNNLMDFIEAQLVKRRFLNISLQGST